MSDYMKWMYVLKMTSVVNIVGSLPTLRGVWRKLFLGHIPHIGS